MIKILVADGSTVQRLVLQRQLERLGYTVVTAASGHEALMAFDESIAAVLVDCEMPELDGFEVARILRLRESGQRCRIFATSTTGNTSRERCLEAGMEDVFVKPIALAQLKSRLGRALDSRQKSTTNGAIEDWESISALDRLGRQTGRDLVREVLHRFLREGSRKLAEMRRALECRDAAALARAAHFMAGSSSILRVRALSAGFRALESAAAERDFAACDAELENAEKIFRKLADELIKVAGEVSFRI